MQTTRFRLLVFDSSEGAKASLYRLLDPVTPLVRARTCSIISVTSLTNSSLRLCGGGGNVYDDDVVGSNSIHKLNKLLKEGVMWHGEVRH